MDIVNIEAGTFEAMLSKFEGLHHSRPCTLQTDTWNVLESIRADKPHSLSGRVSSHPFFFGAYFWRANRVWIGLPANPLYFGIRDFARIFPKYVAF